MALDDRIKTDIRVASPLIKIVDEQGKKLGIPKNAFFTAGACLLAVQLAPMLGGVKKRDQMLDAIEKVFAETLEKARNS